MWLFDNLFLDANTPITINDGVDHSKDVIQTIIDPTFVDAKPRAMTTGDIGVVVWKNAETKKDGSLVDLFRSDTKEERDAMLTLHPEPPRDIALDIGHTPSAPLPSGLDPAVNFDIGWDLSFDIGWDISGVSATIVNWSNLGSWSPLPGSISISSIENILPEILNKEDSPHIDISSSVSTGAWASANIVNVETPDITPEISVQDTSSNNTLFSLLNTPIQTSDPQSESSSGSEVSAAESASHISPVSSVFPSLFADTNIANTPDVPLAEIPNAIKSVSTENTWVWWVIVSWLQNSFGGDTSSNHQVNQNLSHSGAVLWYISSSSKLKSKLTQFLGELESMEVGDESQKTHKIQQIDMCRMRISEIRIEYDTRIRALQWEMQALEQEVRDMDGEKNHIKTVIETFQKELEMT